jgi:O-antigen/teichoic acid export membrane protein
MPKAANRIQLPSIGRDSLLTYATEGLALLGMVLTYRLAAQAGKEGMDVYVIARRTVAFLFPLVLMGAMVGLTRHVAMSPSPQVARRYLLGALSLVAPLGALVCVVGWAFAKPLAWMLFDDPGSAAWVPPIGVMTTGIALHGVSYGYLRGRGAIVMANALQFVVLALAPCLAFVFHRDMADVLWTTGYAWVGAPVLSILPDLLAGSAGPIGRERAELLRYGLPRVPGDVALGALLTVPGYVALRTHGLGLSGEVGFGATLLNIAAAAFSPVALLLLPSASAQLAKGDHGGLAKRVQRMSRLILLASIALTVGFELLAAPVLEVYLGPPGAQYLPMSRLIFIAALPFAYFNGMRSLLDAYFRTPRNGINLTKSFVLLLVGGAFHLMVPTPWYTMAVVLICALAYLGWATWRDVRFVGDELRRLAAQEGHALRVLVVVPEEEEGPVYADARRESEALRRLGGDVAYFHLRNRTSFWRLWLDRQRLQRTLKRVRPDVVHVQYGSVAGLFTVLSSPLPVVVTFVGDDLDRSTVSGLVRPWLGRLFSQLAAFFAAGIICRHAVVRDQLWWRASEALLPSQAKEARVAQTFAHLRTVAMHKPSEA